MEVVTLGPHTAWIDPRGAVWFPDLQMLVIRVPDLAASLFPEVDLERIHAIAAQHEPTTMVLMCTGAAPELASPARIIEIGPQGFFHWSGDGLHFSLEDIGERPLILGSFEGELGVVDELLSLPEINKMFSA
ncbi:MAG: hypothetical protein JNJ45_03915 [Chthonomonas sp.]|nr:hypothetical protein [Chthonomonas sp.]